MVGRLTPDSSARRRPDQLRSPRAARSCALVICLASCAIIRRSKTDQEGAGQEIAIPCGYRLRPVEAVQTWLAAAEINRGPVFRPVLKGSRPQSEPLTDRSVAKIVKHYAGFAGLDPAQFAGHSR